MRRVHKVPSWSGSWYFFSFTTDNDLEPWHQGGSYLKPGEDPRCSQRCGPVHVIQHRWQSPCHSLQGQKDTSDRPSSRNSSTSRLGSEVCGPAISPLEVFALLGRFIAFQEDTSVPCVAPGTTWCYCLLLSLAHLLSLVKTGFLHLATMLLAPWNPSWCTLFS